MQVQRQFKIPVFTAKKAQFERSRLLISARLRGRRKPLPVHSLIPSKLQYAMMTDALRKAVVHHLPRDISENLGPCQPQLPVDARTVDKPWEKELKFGRWLAVAPGAAHETKRAPTELFMSILVDVKARQKNDSPLGLVFLGDENDRKIALGIYDKISWSGPVLNLAGKLSLWETSLALRDCDMLLSNDSALAHIAEAVNTPVTVLFGPTIEGFGFGPRLPNSRAFSVLLGCRPCSKHGKVPCRYNDKLCFATISPLDVATRILTVLGESGVGSGTSNGPTLKASRLGRPEILPQSRDT
jgi:ADP-heptose:LPS heptosyltransferase